MMSTGAGGSTALVDTSYSKSELFAAAVESDMQVYSLSVFDPPLNKKPIELGEQRNGVFFMEELGRRTGGVQMVVRDSAEINWAATRIGNVDPGSISDRVCAGKYR